MKRPIFALALTIVLLLPATTQAHRLNVDPASVEHYIRLEPQTDGLAVLFDKHLGELASRTAAMRIDTNSNGKLEEAELRENLRSATPAYLRKLTATVALGEKRLSLPLKLASHNLNEDAIIYIVKSPDVENRSIWTIRMRWQLFAPWPQSVINITPNHPGITNQTFSLDFATQFDSYPALFSQITVHPPEKGLTLISRDIPTANEVPLPPDEPEPVEGIQAEDIPRVTNASLQLAWQHPASTGAVAQKQQTGSPYNQPKDATAALEKSASPSRENFFTKTEASLRNRLEALFMPPHKTVTWVVAIAICLLWGAVHAFAPGHGKTIVSASLVGMHAGYRHAVILGIIVTLTHTAVVLVLAVAAVILKERFVYPQWLEPLGAVIIMLVGVNQIRLGLTGALTRSLHAQSQTNNHQHNPGCQHTHEHDHPHPHSHSDHDHIHSHSHHDNAHSHDHQHPHPHSHSSRAPHDESHTHWGIFRHSHSPLTIRGNTVTWQNLTAIGATGGMVPCPAAIIMILLSWQVRSPELGLACLVSFGIGLATTIVVIGCLAVSGARFIERWLLSRGRQQTVRLEVVLPTIGGFVLIICGWLLLKA